MGTKKVFIISLPPSFPILPFSFPLMYSSHLFPRSEKNLQKDHKEKEKGRSKSPFMSVGRKKGKKGGSFLEGTGIRFETKGNISLYFCKNIVFQMLIN